jgi:hypothetical protein
VRWRERNREMETEVRKGFFFYICIIRWSGGRVSTQPKTQYPLFVRNPNKKNNINRIRPYICSRAGGRTNGSAGFIGRVGFHGFLPTPIVSPLCRVLVFKKYRIVVSRVVSCLVSYRCQYFIAENNRLERKKHIKLYLIY